MNCYKLAQNQDFEDCLAGAMAALLAIAIADTAGKRLSSMPAAPPPPSSSGAAAAVAEEKWATADVGRFLTALKAQLVYWAPLLSKLTQGEEANEEALVLAVEQRLSTSTRGSSGAVGTVAAVAVGRRARLRVSSAWTRPRPLGSPRACRRCSTVMARAAW